MMFIDFHLKQLPSFMFFPPIKTSILHGIHGIHGHGWPWPCRGTTTATPKSWVGQKPRWSRRTRCCRATGTSQPRRHEKRGGFRQGKSMGCKEGSHLHGKLGCNPRMPKKKIMAIHIECLKNLTCVLFAYPNSTFLDTFNHDWIRWRYVWGKHVDTLNVLSGSCILSMCLTTMCLTLLLFEYLWIFIDGETSIAGVRGIFLWDNYGTRYKDLTTIWWPHGELVEGCRGNHPQIGVHYF